MCIIAYKPAGVEMPDKETLMRMFTSNPDGAGFMFTENGNVEIRKGYMSFNGFYSALKSKSYLWKRSPFVLHFRISTQAGVNKECTHPFPLSNRMSDLRQLKRSTDIGIAHNGIISLTSHYSKTIAYSDTMEFITDYLSLIIRNIKYYKDTKTLELIERLADSKLAILDKNGHCQLIGDFETDNGIFYSNSSYKEKRIVTTTYSWNDYDGYSWTHSPTTTTSDVWIKYLNPIDKKYYFDEECPCTEEGVYSYCSKCADFRKCYASSIDLDEFNERN